MTLAALADIDGAVLGLSFVGMFLAVAVPSWTVVLLWGVVAEFLDGSGADDA